MEHLENAEDVLALLPSASVVLIVTRIENLGWTVDVAGDETLCRADFVNLLVRYAAASNGNAQAREGK